MATTQITERQFADAVQNKLYINADAYQFGFVTDYAANQQTTISFDGTNTFTLAPTGTSWQYYRNGTRYTVTGSVTATLSGSPPATAGGYYIYIDSTNGSLTSSTSGWTLEDSKVPVAYIAWNNSLTPKYLIADERHTCAIPRRFHWEHHFSDGTEIMTSPVLTGPDVAPLVPVDWNNCFGASNSIAADEDLKISVSALSRPSGTTMSYNVFYRISGSVWNWTTSQVPYLYASGSYVYYDNAGTMTASTAGNYVNTYLLVTNIRGTYGYSIIHGQANFTSLSTAQAETFTSLTKTGLPIGEYVAVFQFTWATGGGYSTKGKVRLAATPVPIVVSASGVSSGGGSPASGTFALLDAEQTFTKAQTVTVSEDVTSTKSALVADYTAARTSAEHSATYRGITAQVTLTGDVVVDSNGLYGIYGGATHNGSATLANLTGGDFRATLSSSGSVSSVYGVRTTIASTGAGTFTNAFGVYTSIAPATNARGVYIAGSTTPGGTAKYGLQITDVTGSTSAYSLYTGAGKAHFGDDIDTYGRIGIGSGAALHPLEVYLTNNSANIGRGILLWNSYSANRANSGPAIHEVAGFLPTGSAERLGIVGWGAMVTGSPTLVSSTYYLSSALVGYSDGGWSVTSAPSYFSFQTTPTGSVTRAERMRIASTGYVGVANTSPAYPLDVTGDINSSSGVRQGGVSLYATGSWVPGFTGFSTNPTGTIARYVVSGKLCTAMVYMPSNGISNATGFTISAPFGAANVPGMYWGADIWAGSNSGTVLVTPGRVQITCTGTTFSLYPSQAAGNWINGGAKGGSFTIQYEIA